MFLNSVLYYESVTSVLEFVLHMQIKKQHFYIKNRKNKKQTKTKSSSKVGTS